MLEKLDLDDDGKLPIAIFADPVLTFSCVCVCTLSSPQLVLARYNEGEDDQDVLPDSGECTTLKKKLPPLFAVRCVRRVCRPVHRGPAIHPNCVSITLLIAPTDCFLPVCSQNVCVFALFASRLLVVTVLNTECCGWVDE